VPGFRQAQHEEVFSMVSQTLKEETRSRLVRMTEETGREVMSCTEKGDAWTILIRQDLYHVAIMHQGEERYIRVVFPARLTDSATIRKIDAALQNPLERAGFDYQLKRIISTPSSSFRIHMSGDMFAGFDTVAKIYPFDQGFSLYHLDAALQSVVGTGIVGIAFIATIIDGKELEQQVGAYLAKASPEGMYS
jgi:hypothetical protein